MSPQTRRGRATPASHRKASTKGATSAQNTPETESAPESEGSVAARHHTATPGVRRRGAAPAHRHSMLRNIYAYVKVYIPLFLAFLVLFAGVWAYISFGPHTPTPKDHWTTIETKWKPKVEADEQHISAAVNDFTAQQAAYKTLRDDITGWMTDLTAVTDWSDARASADVNVQTKTDVSQFIQAGGDEASLLDQAVTAPSANDVLAMGQLLRDQDAAFWKAYGVARADIFAESASSSLEPTIALPSGSLSPSESPGASGSPSASASPAADSGASAVPSGSPGPS